MEDGMDTMVKRFAAVAVVLLLAACGGGGGGGGEGDGEALDVTAREFEFEPSEWTAPADTDTEITLTNEGDAEHEWAVIAGEQRIETEDEFEEDIVAFEVAEVEPGATGSGTFNLPAGTYQVICAVSGHFSAGMEGTLTVEG
jgi:uncharacterized cupredoxin-like copper-binding protein